LEQFDLLKKISPAPPQSGKHFTAKFSVFYLKAKNSHKANFNTIKPQFPPLSLTKKEKLFPKGLLQDRKASVSSPLAD